MQKSGKILINDKGAVVKVFPGWIKNSETYPIFNQLKEEIKWYFFFFNFRIIAQLSFYQQESRRDPF